MSDEGRSSSDSLRFHRDATQQLLIGKRRDLRTLADRDIRSELTRPRGDRAPFVFGNVETKSKARCDSLRGPNRLVLPHEMPDLAKSIARSDGELPIELHLDDPPTGLEDQQRSFLRMVSHELRTPLNTIVGFADILSKELYGPLGSPNYRDYAELIVTSGQRLLTLANQVIEIAKLEGRSADLQITVQSIDHALDDILDHLRDSITTAEIDLIVENRGCLPSVRADDKGLRTLLGNLISNACNHCPKRAKLVISTVQTGTTVAISLADNGPGIALDDLARVLRPFEQGEPALNRRSQGAGLGLPIVSLWCRAMEGRMEMSSVPGVGLTVCIYLTAA